MTGSRAPDTCSRCSAALDQQPRTHTRPILTTTFATIIGFAPFALGDSAVVLGNTVNDGLSSSVIDAAR